MSGRHRKADISEADLINARDVRSDLDHDIRDLIKSAIHYLVTDLSHECGDGISTTDAYRAMGVSELMRVVAEPLPVKIVHGDSRGVFYDLFDEEKARKLTET